MLHFTPTGLMVVAATEAERKRGRERERERGRSFSGAGVSTGRLHQLSSIKRTMFPVKCLYHCIQWFPTSLLVRKSTKATRAICYNPHVFNVRSVCTVFAPIVCDMDVSCGGLRCRGMRLCTCATLWYTVCTCMKPNTHAQSSRSQVCNQRLRGMAATPHRGPASGSRLQQSLVRNHRKCVQQAEHEGHFLARRTRLDSIPSGFQRCHNRAKQHSRMRLWSLRRISWPR